MSISVLPPLNHQRPLPTLSPRARMNLTAESAAQLPHTPPRPLIRTRPLDKLNQNPSSRGGWKTVHPVLNSSSQVIKPMKIT
jgi:hypothetical protein